MDNVLRRRFLDEFTASFIENGIPNKDGSVGGRSPLWDVTSGAYDSVTDTSTIREVFFWKSDDGVHERVLIWQADSLYEWDYNDSATFTVRTVTASGIATGSRIAVCQFFDDVYYSDGTNGLIKLTFDPVTNEYFTASTAEASYSFSALEALDTIRIFGIDADEPERLRWCGVGDAELWSTGDDPPGGSRVFNHALTAIRNVGSVLIVAGESRMSRIDGTDAETWTVREIESDGIGVIFPRTLIDVEGVAVFVCNRGLAVYDGSRPHVISQKADLQDLISDNLGHTLLPFGIRYGSWVMFALPNSTGARTTGGCDIIWCLDFERQAFFTWKQIRTAQGAYFTCAWENGYDKLHFGGTSGIQVQYDEDAYGGSGQGIDFGNTNNTHLMKVKSKGWDDTRPGVDKILKEVRVVYSIPLAYGSYESDVTVNVYAEEGDSSPVATTTVTVDSDTDEGLILKRIQNARCRSFYVEIEVDGRVPVNIHSIEVDHFFVRRRS